ncbi:MAG TPA: hypothetical protein VHC91_18355 [Trinickia sp.]|uniref:hypothetical protein n=1 Tax=Trinickia sp. TaxID=2571163 RepID=UPI002C4E35B8|nr:hypothetical protein [Trinickia sp.]HVW52320.1 hypothetical protein [Trinickia sp.]
MNLVNPIVHKPKRHAARRILALISTVLTLAACDRPQPIAALDIYREYPPGKELFELSNGVNEFDLLHVDGFYYMFHHDFNALHTSVRRAATLDSLVNAPDFDVLPGLYPTAIYDGGLWHAWVYDGAHTVHYTASNWSGPYTKADTIDIFAASDWSVRKNPLDGQYYASYKDGRTGLAMLERARSPNGPWNALGRVFPADKVANWYSAEQADPYIFFYHGRAYLAFAGWGGRSFKVADGEQVIGIVELESKTYHAKQIATRLIRPTQPWQQRGGGRKIFNPEFIEATDHRPKIVYAVNPSGSNIQAGWGYVDLDRIVERKGG